MLIRVVQSGGVAGLRRENAVETERLGEPLRQTLERLIERADFFELPSRLVSGYPDVIQYRIVVRAEHRVHEVIRDDESADETLRALVERVLDEPGNL